MPTTIIIIIIIVIVVIIFADFILTDEAQEMSALPIVPVDLSSGHGPYVNAVFVSKSIVRLGGAPLGKSEGFSSRHPDECTFFCLVCTRSPHPFSCFAFKNQQETMLYRFPSNYDILFNYQLLSSYFQDQSAQLVN